MPMPATAKTMWKASDTAICKRAASRSLMSLAPLTYTTSLPEAQCLWVTHEPLIPDHRANSRQAPSHEHATNAGAPRAVQKGIATSSDSQDSE